MKPTITVEMNHKARKNGLYDIFLRLTYNRKIKRKSLGIHVKKNDFNKAAKYGKWVRTSDPKHEQKNLEIQKGLEKFRDELWEVLNDGEPTPQIIENVFEEKKVTCFIKYSRERIEKDATSRKFSYKRQMEAAINKLETYVDNRELPFNQITPGFIRDYENYLKGTLKNSTNTITGNLKKIRSLLYNAIIDGHFSQQKNPFFTYKLKSAPTIKERLTAEEITRLENADLEIGSTEWHARNYFLFSYYCAGIRAGDMISLCWRNVHDNRRLVYQMSKNGKYTDLILVPQAKKILELYRKPYMKENDLIFPLVPDPTALGDPLSRFHIINSKTTLVNLELKKVALKAKIKKNLSFHIARHSFADIARKSGASVYSISKALNHGKISTTEAYLSAFDQQATDDLIRGLFAPKAPEIKKKGARK